MMDLSKVGTNYVIAINSSKKQFEFTFPISFICFTQDFTRIEKIFSFDDMKKNVSKSWSSELLSLAKY